MKLYILFLLSLSGSIEGMWFDDMHDTRESYIAPLAPSLPLPPATTKQERKTHKEIKNQKLMHYAQQMVAQKENLDNQLCEYDFESHTLLTAAASHKYHQDVIQFALSHGAHINAPNKSGNTPLEVAVRAKCFSNVSYLFAHGATLGNQKMLSTICSPAWDEIAPSSTYRRVATLKALLHGGADPNEINLKYQIHCTPCLLSFLLCHFYGRINFGAKGPEYQERYHCFLDQRKQMIGILLDAGLNPFKKDEAGKNDWEKIVELKDKYDSNLFEFAKNEIEKKQRIK